MKGQHLVAFTGVMLMVVGLLRAESIFRDPAAYGAFRLILAVSMGIGSVVVGLALILFRKRIISDDSPWLVRQDGTRPSAAPLAELTSSESIMSFAVGAVCARLLLLAPGYDVPVGIHLGAMIGGGVGGVYVARWWKSNRDANSGQGKD